MHLEHRKRKRMATILVVEDERDLCNLIRGHLEAVGHTVYQAFDGSTALEQVEAHHPHLLILDWMLPGLDGLSVCRQVRQQHLMPILMLTARSEEVDRVLGLEVGADDYVVKPFGMRELLARVHAILRRVELNSRPPLVPGKQETQVPSSAPVIYGPLCIHLASHLATLEGAELDLTPKEFELLALLVAHPGRVFHRTFLLDHVWGYQYDGIERTVDSHITRLRKKLGPLGEKLTNVWGVGYRFSA